jgi:predicted Zn-dependent peptidase
MRVSLVVFVSVLLVASFLSCQRQGVDLQIPSSYYTLDNGLKVVLSQDRTSPTVGVGVYYNIGFRLEPRNRTGFAHLFEHMMFQGSRNLGKMEFAKLVENNGGILDGSTRFDFTNYFQIVPSHKLETILWAEADRMRGLDITQENLVNQQGVVTNEVKVNVLNQPYGGFPWLDLPQAAFANWYNAHNFYGDLGDITSATLEDVKSFFRTYYAPGNAVLAVVGDFEPDEARGMIQKYFGRIPRVEQPQRPDLQEPRQQGRKRISREDPLAKKPALAFGYQMPPRFTPEYFAMGLIDQILLQGDDAWLRDALVQRRGWTGSVTGGINADLGNMFNYNGPMLWSASLIHDQSIGPDQIVAVVDSVVDAIVAKPVDSETLDRAKVKFRSRFYDMMGEMLGLGKLDLLASFALFDNDPSKLNVVEAEIRKVTPDVIQKTAQEYLRPTNQTVVALTVGTGSSEGKTP